MRRRLITVFLAISVMITVAFVLPLGLLVRTTAEDRATDAARADAASLVPLLVAGSSSDQIEIAMGATRSGRAGRTTVVTSSGWTIGPLDTPSARLDAALAQGTSAIGPVDGGVEVVTAVATGPGELSAIRVFVPDEDLRRGQTTAWAALAGVAVALVALSVVLADRLARSIVRPTQELAGAAHRLGEGDLQTRVDPQGPPELVELSGAFNRLGTQVSTMLARERELVAELSHRLRTPLTALRLRVDQVDDPALAEDLRRDVDDVTRVVNELIHEARASIIEHETCDAVAVVSDRVEYWSALAEDTERRWSFVCDDGPLRVRMSAAALDALVDVLIENVFSHTDDGTEFAVRVRADAERVAVVVEDAGPGFDDAVVRRGHSGSGSTGLGLDIARSSAESAGGGLEIEQSPLGGAAVVVLLPRDTPGGHRPAES